MRSLCLAMVLAAVCRQAMRSLCLAMVFAAVCFTPQCSSQSTDVRRLGKAISFFSTDLTKVLSLRSGNVVFSPVSIHMALTMTLLGAKGETAREIRTLLEATRLTDLENLYKSWLETANVNCVSQINCQMRIQNLVWKSSKMHYHEQFLKSLNSTFAPDNGRLKFASGWTQINFWTDLWGSRVNRFTIDPVYVSAVNIKLSWKIPFRPKKYASMLFVTESRKEVVVWSMIARGQFKYAFSADVKCHVVRIPLENDRFGFYIIFPLYEDGLAQAENTLARRGVDLDSVFESVRDRKVQIELPMFDVVHKINLKEPLREMGIRAASSSSADFTKATPKKIKVGQVRQRILVTLRPSHLRVGSEHPDNALEGGREAPSTGDASPKQKRRGVAVEGNATMNYKGSESIESVASTAQPYLPEIFIHASHSFLYFLRDDLNGVLLLHGRLVEPQTNVVTEY